MKIFADKDIKNLFFALTGIWVGSLSFTEGVLWLESGRLSVGVLLVFLLTAAALWTVCMFYFRRQNSVMEEAVSVIRAYLDGDEDARIECAEEGELYRLFHAINSLAAVLSAHADNEQREKEFLKQTISDISHQLKTPLAALNIYNGLLQEDMDAASVKQFADLSEQELDRIEMLVQNLLKLAKLDAGTIVLEMAKENVADMMRDVEMQFAYRVKQEGKELLLSGAEEVSLICDRNWLSEAVDNLVKNALDHTGTGDIVRIEWQTLPTGIRIAVWDNGSGIHPEDMPHIFKRFYRSRFSQDTQGIGLGLPLAKAIVEAHGGVIEADSNPGQGTLFIISFPTTANPTKL